MLPLTIRCTDHCLSHGKDTDRFMRSKSVLDYPVYGVNMSDII